MKGKQLNVVALGIAWMLSLGAVFILGILSAFAFHLAPGAGGEAAGDLSLDQRDLVLLIERYTGESVDIPPLFSVTDDTAAPEQLELTLRAVMREEDPEMRQIAATRMVRGLPLRRVMGAIRFLQEIPSSPARDELLKSFIEAWASRDGRSAIAFSTSLPTPPEKQLAIGAALRGWSLERPSDAWNWVIERGGGSRRTERWLGIILRNLGVTDRQTAFQLIERLPSTDFQVQMSVIVMDQILQTDSPRDALVLLSDLPSVAAGPVGAFIAERWAFEEPETAAVWLQRSFPSEIDGMANVLREWAYTYPESAADWCWENYSGAMRGELITVIAEEWVGNDGPTPLAEWLNIHGPDPALDGAIEALSLATSQVDPATALVWAQSITDPDTRSMLEIVIGREWIRINRAEAEETLPVVLQSETARAALLEPEYEIVEEDIYDDTRVDEQAVPMEEEPIPAQ